MNNSALRDKIHQLVGNSDDEDLQAVYQILQQTEYTDEFKNVLNEEFADYQKTKKVINKKKIELLKKEELKKAKKN